MQLKAIQLHRKFTTCDEFNPAFLASRDHTFASIYGIVIGEGHHFQTPLMTVLRQLLWRVGAV